MNCQVLIRKTSQTVLSISFSYILNLLQYDELDFQMDEDFLKGKCLCFVIKDYFVRKFKSIKKISFEKNSFKIYCLFNTKL